MIIDIDAGNTRIKWQASIRHQVVVSGIDEASESPLDAVYAALSEQPKVLRVRLLSVRSKADTAIIVTAVKSLWLVDAEIINSAESACGVTNGYSQADSLGVDRWSALVAGVQLAEQAAGSKAVCVVDAGSALTIDLVDNKGAHEGGFIVPGLAMQLRALSQGTGNIDLAGIPVNPAWQPATNTYDAVIAGVILGAQQLIITAVSDFERRHSISPRLLLTGGDGPTLLQGLDAGFDYRPRLVLEGMVFLCP